MLATTYCCFQIYLETCIGFDLFRPGFGLPCYSNLNRFDFNYSERNRITSDVEFLQDIDLFLVSSLNVQDRITINFILTCRSKLQLCFALIFIFPFFHRQLDVNHHAYVYSLLSTVFSQCHLRFYGELCSLS